MANKFNIKDQLAGIAALIAAIVAIGGGFVKYGEITTKLSEIEARESKDYSAQIAVLEGASKGIDMSFLSEIRVLEEKVEALEAGNNGDVDDSLSALDKRSAINKKEIELLKVQIEEIKVSTSNPLSN